MKQKFIIYSILAAATVALSACDGNEDAIGAPVEAQFYAELPGGSTTRADKESFAANDQIGITGYYTEEGETKVMNSANLCYYNDNTEGDAWKPYGDNDKFLFRNTSTVTFSAYYPYSSEVSDNVMEIDDTTDILYATATGGINSTTTVSFNEFSHALSKLTFTFTAGDGMTTSKIQNLSFTVSGLVKSGTFNTLTGKAASSGSTTTDITLSTGTSLTASTSAIPQVATITLKLSYSGSTYSVSLGSVTLTGGNEYCYNITVKKYEVLACSSSITSWSNGASSTIASSKTYGALRYPQNAGDYMYSDGSYDLYTTTLTSEKKSACTGVYIGEVNGVGRVITYVGGYVYYYEIYEDYYKLGTVADCYFIYENITQINSSLENCGMNSVYNKNYNNYFWIYNKEICDSLDYDIDAIPYCMFNSARIEFGTIYESYYDAYDEEMYVNHRYFYVSNCYKLN